MESKFSPALIELMNKEDLAAAQNRFDVHEQICKKVDAGLKAETQRHCEMQALANAKRWTALLEKQAEESLQFFNECLSAVNTTLNMTTPLKSKESLTLEEAFELEDLRLKRDAFKNYYK